MRATVRAVTIMEVYRNTDNKNVRFSGVDALIILVVAVILVGVGWYFFGDALFDDSDNVRISYAVRLTNVKSELTSHIHYGDAVYDSVYGELIGTVEKVRTEQYTEQVMNKSTGELVNSVKAGYYNIYITVNTTAKFSNNTYYAADTEIRVGEAVYLRLPDFCGSGFCTALAVADTEV